ncbi:MAG: hypothetical protein JHC71_16345 [Blastococcus sp.]|nr:hypothetical protein [Blastococcus sp.]
MAATVGGGDPDVRVRDIAPADARARLADALRDPDLDVLSGRSTPWRQLRPLVGWLVSVLPDGGDASVPGLWDDVDLDDVVAGFLASQWGRPWVRGGLPELVEAVLGDGLGNGLGDPLLWALHHVARLLDHESSALDHDELDTARTPELLRDVIRYGHAERGLPPRAHGRRAGRGGPPQRPLPRRRPRLARRRGMTTSPVGCVSRGVPEDTRLPCSHLWTTSTRSLVRAPEFPTMSTRPHPTVPVTDDVELTERWRALLQLDGPPSRRRLFLAWLRRDGTMVPLLMPVDDVPLEPDRLSLGNLAAVHATVAETEDVDPGDLHLALLLERHGPAGLSPDDHAWCSAVEALLRDRAGLDCSMHIGNGRTAVPVLQRRSWPLP